MQCGFWQPRVHVQDDGSALGRPLGFPELCGNFLRSSRRSALDSFVAVLPLPPAVNEPPLLLLKGDTASTEGGGIGAFWEITRKTGVFFRTNVSVSTVGTKTLWTLLINLGPYGSY